MYCNCITFQEWVYVIESGDIWSYTFSEKLIQLQYVYSSLKSDIIKIHEPILIK